MNLQTKKVIARESLLLFGFAVIAFLLLQTDFHWALMARIEEEGMTKLKFILIVITALEGARLLLWSIQILMSL